MREIDEVTIYAALFEDELVATNRSKKDILLNYPSLDKLCEALDTCSNLEQWEYCDAVTQANFNELAKYSALELYHAFHNARR